MRRARIVFDLPVARVDDECLKRLYGESNEIEESVMPRQRMPLPTVVDA